MTRMLMLDKKTVIFEALEERVLLSGVPLEVDSAIHVALNLSSESPALAITEILIVDTAVDSYEDLLSDFDQSLLDIHFIDSLEDGVNEISSILSSYKNLDAIHILSHGSEASVNLGSVVVDTGSLSSYSDQISSWSKALSDSADILFYGCNVASGTEGQAFVSSIATLTGADVAASDDRTGLGGDAELEIELGSIEATELFTQESYDFAHVSLGGGLILGGVDGVATAPSSTDYNKGVGEGHTVELWVKTTDANGGSASRWASAQDGFILSVQDGKLAWRVATTASGGQAGTWGTVTINDGTWHHVALVISSTDVKTYVDGVLDSSFTNSYVNNDWTITEDLKIGYVPVTSGGVTLSGANAHLEGSIKNVRIWQQERAVGEINADMNNDVPVSNVTNLVANFLLNETTGTTAVDSVAGNNAVLSGGVTWTAPTLTNSPSSINVDQNATSDFDLSGVVFADTQGDDLTVSLTAAAGTFTATSAGGVTVGASGTGTLTLAGTITDIHTYLDTISNVQYTGSVATTVEIKANDGAIDSHVKTINVVINIEAFQLVLDGVDGIATAPSSSDYNKAVGEGHTVELWVKTTDTDGGLVSRWASAQDGYALMVQGGKLAWRVATTASGGQAGTSGIATINDNIWHHVALVISSTDVKAYVDGTLDSNFTHPYVNNNWTINEELKMGYSPVTSGGGGLSGASAYLEGAIKNVRVWQQERTAQELTDDMNNDVPVSNVTNLVANFILNEISTLTAVDSVSANNATLSGGASWAAPSITNAPETINVDNNVASDFDLSNVVFADAQGDSLTVTLTAGTGLFTATTAGGVTVGGSGTSTLTLAGTIADLHTFLDTVSNVQYTGSVATTVELKVSDGTVDSSSEIVNLAINLASSELVLDGVDGVATAATSIDYDKAVGQGHTVELWVKTTDTDGGLASRWASAQDGFILTVQGGRLAWRVATTESGGQAGKTGAATINDGSWHHVALVVSATDVKAYVDGVLDSSFTHPYANDDWSINEELKIGYSPVNTAGTSLSGANAHLVGSIKNLRLWQQERTVGEIAADMNNDVPLSNVTNLVANFIMNETSGTVAVDSISGNNAILSGGASWTAPVITNVAATINVADNIASDFDLSNVVFYDPQGDNITVTLTAGAGIFTASTGGGVTVGGSATGTLTLAGSIADIHTFLDTVSNVQYTGVVATTVEIKANDAQVFSSPASIDVTVNIVNDGASIVTGGTDSSTVLEGGNPTNTLTVTDVDGISNVSFALTVGQTIVNGNPTISAGGLWAFNPTDANWSGTESFTVDVTDDQGFVTVVTITATVTPVNDAAIAPAASHELAVDFDNLDISGQLRNTDVDNNDNIFQAKTETGAYGTLVFAADGSYSYIADSSFVELPFATRFTDVFTILTEDGTETRITVNLERPAHFIPNIIDSTMEHSPEEFSLEARNQLLQTLKSSVSEEFFSLLISESSLDLGVVATGDLLTSIEYEFAIRPAEDAQADEGDEGLQLERDFYEDIKLTPSQIQFIESLLQEAKAVNDQFEEASDDEGFAEHSMMMTLPSFDFITELEGQVNVEEMPKAVTMAELDGRKSLDEIFNSAFNIFP